MTAAPRPVSTRSQHVMRHGYQWMAESIGLTGNLIMNAMTVIVSLSVHNALQANIKRLMPDEPNPRKHRALYARYATLNALLLIFCLICFSVVVCGILFRKPTHDDDGRPLVQTQTVTQQQQDAGATTAHAA